MVVKEPRIPGYLAHDELRPGQDELIGEAYDVLINKGSHLACAPTGIGKTAAALSAALDASFSSNEKRTIFFLTGRQAQHRIVVETVRNINKRRTDGQSIVKLVDIVGQQSMCIDDIRKEFSSLFSRLCADKRKNRHCRPYLQEVEGLRLKVLQEPLHVNELIQVSKSFTEDGKSKATCPWKAARESASGADIIVCDYNHLFHERVRAASLDAMGIKLNEIIIIVDEAHNLPDRITKGMQRTINDELVLSARLEMEEHIETLEEKEKKGLFDVRPETYANLRAVKAAIERIRADLAGFFRTQTQSLYKQKADEARIDNQDLLNLLSSALSSDISGNNLSLNQISEILASVEVELDPDLDEGKETASERLSELFSLIDRLGENRALAFIFSHGKGDAPRLTTHLLDPGIVSGPVFEEAAGALLMSGTLSPPEMYGELLSLPSTRPVSSKPIIARNIPIPAPVAIFKSVGIALIILVLQPT